jgi:glycosyltransferase involved in cell wall biosynthesis
MGKEIVILIYTLTPTGGLKVLFKIGNKLKERGHQVSFFVSETSDLHPLQYQNDCKILYANKPLDNRLFKRLAYLLKAKINADVVLATYFPTAIGAYFNPNIKGRLLYYVQADETHFFSFRLITLARRIHYYLLAKLSYLVPITKIVNCEGSKASLSKNTTYQEIPPGFDPEIYFPRKNKSAKLRVGHLSRIERRKGSTEFFMAMKALKELGADFDLYIAYDFCKDTLGLDYERIMPKNEIELAEFYSSCDVVVSAVWEKGFAYPPLETMACGSISIATPIDYASAGVDHVAIPINNADAIKNAVLWVMNNPVAAEKIRLNGITTAKQYTWERIIDQWELAIQS